MSHIHIPDGVLPVWLWAAGWALSLALLWVASARAARADVRRKVPLVAVISALVLIAMSSEIVPIAYHVNLTVVAGALLGPQLAIVSAFVVQVTLALLGHGGVTVIGLNVLMTATEMILGWLLFRGFVRLLSRRHVRWAGALATVLTLAVTTTMLVGVVALAGTGAATERETGALDPQNLNFASPFSDSVFQIGLFSGGEHADETPDSARDGAGGTSTSLSVSRFATVVYTLGPIGWLIEALVTAAVLGYVAHVRPSLLFEGALTVRGHPHYGDEHGRH
jgi:cobalt/nickel transport system permease protein